MLKILALSLISLSGYLLFNEIKRTLSLGLLQSEEFLRFLVHIKEKVTAYSLPSSQWCADFQSEALLSCGFITGESFNSDAEYLLSDKRLFIPKEQREKLASFFSENTSASLELEIKRINNFELEFEKTYQSFRLEVAKRVKCYGVIIAAIALGITILFL